MYCGPKHESVTQQRVSIISHAVLLRLHGRRRQAGRRRTRAEHGISLGCIAALETSGTRLNRQPVAQLVRVWGLEVVASAAVEPTVGLRVLYKEARLGRPPGPRAAPSCTARRSAWLLGGRAGGCPV
jgi:hypothetical protein